jgi:putative DNA primase/helicase
MSIHDAMADACRAVGIVPPARTAAGRWVPTPAEGKARSNTAGRVMIFQDQQGGVCWNWTTGEQRTFRLNSDDGQPVATRAPRRDPEAERRAAQEQAEVERICTAIVRACAPASHPYLAAKGFPQETGLVVDDLRRLIPSHDLGKAIARALPEGDGPWLIVPGRIGSNLATVQIIAPDGGKKNLYRGKMGGAAHRIATGRETWVCEGIATALSVRAALRLLGRPATVLCAFSASNVAKVAAGIPGSIIAADHDKPLEQLHGLGTGEFYARATGLRWVMPPELGDWNDHHKAHGLRAVAIALREVAAT